MCFVLGLQWAPAACQGFLLVTFRIVGALRSFEFSKSGRAPLNTNWQKNPKPKNSPPYAGMLILFRFFLGILLLNPRFFFHHIVAQVCPSIWHFENSSLLLWNQRYSEKGNLLDPFVHTFSFAMPFNMNLNIQNSWPHWSSTFRSQFSTGNHFHVKWSTNPRATSILPTASIPLFALPGRFQLCYYCSKFSPRFSVC